MEELQKLFTKARNTSEFIIATKEKPDGIGARLVVESLETLDQAVKDSLERNPKVNHVLRVEINHETAENSIDKIQLKHEK